MEHLIDRINWRMMEFYSGEDSRQIAHTQCVHDYTRLLAAKSGVEPHRAILHDKGCYPLDRAAGRELFDLLFLK